MISGMKRLVADTLTRKVMDNAVKNFASNYCKEGPTYDIGGVPRYSYNKYFADYKTVNLDKKEKPDILANAAKLPFKNNTVNNILCLAMLEHVRKPEIVIKEMYRVMKKKACALVWVPFYWREHNYPIDNYRYTHQGINALLERHGFKIIDSKSKPYNGFFFILSHNVRFLIKDPRKVSSYDPLLYIHSMLCYLSKLDKVFNLEYPYVYTGVEIVIEKK